ncbi:MAG: carbon-nitrogen family hydrolase [Dehalococcoidia bacterium]|jgi:predicted amidohydrolase
MRLTISLGQMNVRRGHPDANVERVREWTREAAKRGSSLVLFPELWHSGYDLEHRERYAARVGEGIFADTSELAREHKIAIGGSMIEEREGGFYNSFPLFDAEGRCLAVYSKTHLFSLMNEVQWFTPGERFVTADAPWGLTGLSICYDIRFPEVYRHYAFSCARIVLLVAEWPVRRIEHWKTLLLTRAIENQMFIAACNCLGEFKEEKFGGCSAIIDPWGRYVVEAGDEEGLLTAEIDLDLVEKTRRQFPFFKDSRRDLY